MRFKKVKDHRSQKKAPLGEGAELAEVMEFGFDSKIFSCSEVPVFAVDSAHSAVKGFLLSF